MPLSGVTDPAATTAEAEAGTGTALRRWSPERIAEAIAALAGAPGGGGSAFTTVKLISRTNGALATAFEAGDTVDSVVLVADDRILLSAQTAAAENGIYVVQASGAPVRATDWDTGAEIDAARLIRITHGTIWHDTLWWLQTDAPITVDTTTLSFLPLAAQIKGIGEGAISFGTTAVTIYSPEANWIGDDPDVLLTVANSSGYIQDTGGDYKVGIGGGQVELTATHTPGDMASGGVSFEVGIDLEELIISERADGIIQLHAPSSVPELQDEGWDWQHRNAAGTVIKQLKNMEERKGSGTATIASGGTSIVVTHGAGYTPTAVDIMVCPTNNPTNDPGHWWVDTITATQFTIHCRADPGASGASFAWRVDR